MSRQIHAVAPSVGRIGQLDSLRGLAALSVVFDHLLITYPAVWNAYWQPGATPGSEWLAAALFFPGVYLFWAGHSAVILFFVLSGYVLFLPISQGRWPGYLAYAAKRTCRIYLPYVAAVAGAMLGATLFARGPTPELSDWFGVSWSVPVGVGSVLRHAAFLPTFNTLLYNSVIWSLVHEMRISLVYPLIAAAVLRWRAGPCLGVAILVSLAGCFGPRLAPQVSDLADYGATAHYCVMFTLGAVVAKHQGPLTSGVSIGSLSGRWWPNNGP